MAPFRLVAAREAGPGALGLLTPPGRRTIVIVRPRGLPWDLLVVQSQRRTGPTTTFRDFRPEEGAAACEGLYAALQRWIIGEASGSLSVDPGEDGFLVRAQIDVYPLLTCLRLAGQPYQPLAFLAEADAEAAVRSLLAVLHPHTEQEVYFNDRHFHRG